jgi:hypothetical protein
MRWKDISLLLSEEISLPLWQDPPASAPWLPASTLAMARAARTATAHSPPPSEEIGLLPQKDPPVSALWLPTSTSVRSRAARTAAALFLNVSGRKTVRLEWIILL